MPSLSSMSQAIFGSPVRSGGSRHDALRRRTLATVALVFVAAGLVLLVPAILIALSGRGAPLLAIVMALCCGLASLLFGMRRQLDEAATSQVLGLLGMGVSFALAEPAIADFGLAIALLAPIHAAIVGHNKLTQIAWPGFFVVLLLSVLASPGLGPWGAPMAGGLWSGGIAYALCGINVAYAAHRMSAAYQVYERGQINAYKHLVDHMQDTVLRIGDAGEVIFVSRAAEALFGCQRFELTSLGLRERVHVLDRPAYLTALADGLEHARPATLEVRMRFDEPGAPARTPRFIWVEMVISPITDRKEPGAGELVVLMRDVTSRKDLERATQSAREAAEQASAAKSRFLASIGHELRTPLNAIVGFSEMMSGGVGGILPQGQKEYVQLISQSGHHLLGLVNMLLDASRIEAGRFELQTDRFAPEMLLGPSLKMVDKQAVDKKVVLVRHIAPNLPEIEGDERACRQILINLLSNAVKFSHDGGTVTVQMKRQGQSLNISVSDAGIGMSPESLERLGEPFYQAQDGLTRRYDGTGLGLSIVKGLAELHGGQMHATSLLGHGTTMTVLLPINGPETFSVDTRVVTPLLREPNPATLPQWQSQRKRSAR